MNNFNSKAIDKIFKEEFISEHPNQIRLIENIYALVIPNWDSVLNVNGFPICDKTSWKYICNKCMDFDEKFFPKVMNGGAWLNNGFSSDGNLGPWEYSLENVAINYIN